MEVGALQIGYIAIGLLVVVSTVFGFLIMKERQANAKLLELVNSSRDELEKVKTEGSNRASQLSILRGEIARIEQIAEQQGSDSNLSDMSILAHQLRAELQKAQERLAQNEEQFAGCQAGLAILQLKQDDLIVALSRDKFSALVETTDDSRRAELFSFLHDSVDEKFLASVQAVALNTSLGAATLYTLTQDEARRGACVDRLIQLMEQAEAVDDDPAELLNSAWLMLDDTGSAAPPAIRLMERLSEFASKSDDLAIAQFLYDKLVNAHAKLGMRVNSPPLRRAISHVVRVFEKNSLNEKMETAYRHIHELCVVDPGVNKTFMAMNIKKLARIYVDEERYQEAEAMYEIVLNLLMQTEGPDNLDVILHLRDFGKLYMKLGKLKETYKTYLTLLGLPVMKEYEDLVHLVDEVDAAAVLLSSKSKSSEALHLYESTLTALETTGDQVRLAKALDVVAKILSLYERDDQTLEPELIQSASERTFKMMLKLGELQRLTLNYGEAKQTYDTALRMASKNFGAESAQALLAMESCAVLYYETGRQDEARSMLDQVEKIKKQAKAKQPASTTSPK